jgi:recombination protein RecA
MSQAMRKLTGTIARTNTVCIFINQLRDKIGVMFGPSETTTGGNALKFYASVRVDIRPGNAIKDGDNILGKHAKVKIVKNKVAPPFKRCEFDIMFGQGISKASEIIDLGVELGIIQKSGAWFSYNGSKLAQGRDAAKAVIDDNPELAEELEAKIMDAMNAHPAAAEKTSKIKPKTTATATDEEAFSDDAEELDDVKLDDDFNEDFSLEEDL